jgi:trehalose 6-phosphate phosphatase
MPLPTPPVTLLRAASLFLDFDGTLVEIADRPDAVRVDASLQALLRALHTCLHGRLVLISGRPAREVRQLTGFYAGTIVGSHGMEMTWADGRVHAAERPESLDSVLGAMRALAAQLPGVIVEDKPLGAALHFRRVPAAEPDCIALAADLAERHGLHLQHGKMMVEVRAPGGDKGLALAAVMAEPAYAATRPVFMGDDLTDEPGFATAAALDGTGVLVGARRPSAAVYALSDVAAVRRWLEAACRAV